MRDQKQKKSPPVDFPYQDKEKFPPLNVKVGDTLWTPRYGVVTLDHIDTDEEETFRLICGSVERDDLETTFTTNGFYETTDLYPTLFTSEMVIFPKDHSYIFGTLIAPKEKRFVVLNGEDWTIYKEDLCNEMVAKGVIGTESTVFELGNEYTVEEKKNYELKLVK